MKKLSVVIPVYYNQESLSSLFAQLQDVEKNLILKSMTMEFIFVDDGSQDASFEELLKIKQARPDVVKLIKLTRNFGAVKASKTGTKYVTGDCFTILAADLQDPPELILQMVDHWLNGSKYVICVRNSRQDPWLSKLLAKCYYKTIQTMVDKNYPKTGFDIALMDKALQPYLVNSGKNIYTPLYTYSLGFKPVVLSYDRPERRFGKSKWTFKKKITAFLNAILGSSILPIRFISVLGLVVSILSLIYGSVIIINALLGKAILPGYPSIIALILFLLGLVIIMLGMIGEYLWRIFDEVNSGPETVIYEVY